MWWISTALAQEAADGGRFWRHYQDLTVGFGGLYAPFDPSPQRPSDLTGLFRFVDLISLETREGIGTKWFAAGVEIDARGFNTVAHHSALELGPCVSTKWAQAALLTGVGISQRSLDRDRTTFVAWVPARVAATWKSGHSLDVIARGGVMVPFEARRVDLPPLAPDVVLGVTIGMPEPQGVAGLRIEGGWRRELGVDTWTVVVGAGL